MITQTAAKPSPSQRRELLEAKSRLAEALRACDRHSKKAGELQNKEVELRESAEKHRRKAAALDLDSEIQYRASQDMLVRVRQQIESMEAAADDDRLPLWGAIDGSQEIVRVICQPVREKLLDEIVEAIEPYFADPDRARQAAVNFPAVGDLRIRLLGHCGSPGDSIARMIEVARDVLRKIDALLEGRPVWAFGGPAEVSAALNRAPAKNAA